MAQGSLFKLTYIIKNTLEYFPLILEDLKLHDAQVSAIGPMVLLLHLNCVCVTLTFEIGAWFFILICQTLLPRYMEIHPCSTKLWPGHEIGTHRRTDGRPSVQTAGQMDGAILIWPRRISVLRGHKNKMEDIYVIRIIYYTGTTEICPKWQ